MGSWRKHEKMKKLAKAIRNDNYSYIESRERKRREERNKAYLEHFTRLCEERQRANDEY